MWIRCLVILHNLIIRIEEGMVDEEWRQEMYNEWFAREGAQHRQRKLRDSIESEDSSGEDDDEAAHIRRARRAKTTDGEHFRRRVMDALFDSPKSGAVRRNT